MKTRCPPAATALLATIFVLWPATSAHSALDAVSGSSIRVSSTTVASTTAKVTWTFTHTGGTGKIYYGTTQQSTYTSYANNATATSSGTTFTASLSSLSTGTTYYYTVTVSGGGYSTSTSTGTFTTQASTAVTQVRTDASSPKAPFADALGRRKGSASGITVGPDGLGVQVR